MYFWVYMPFKRRLNALTPWQEKLASTSAARRLKLWRWMLSTHAQSRLTVKNLRQIYLSRQYHHWDGRTDLDIQSRLNMMNKVWRSSTYSTRIKLNLYHSRVLTTLLYSSECCRLTEKDLSKTLQISYQEPSAYPTNLLAQFHFK